jgi:Ca2+:H+ antiporter
MAGQTRSALLSWTVVLPVLAVGCVPLTWGRDLGPVLVVGMAGFLAGAVLAAVHHAEVVAHRVGEPFGSLVLAVAVTLIEVGLIVTLMVAGGPDTASLARDTVFAAVMITCNGIVGLSLLLGALRHGLLVFNAEGSGAALATVVTLATLTLVFPTFTTSEPGPEFSTSQLAFAAVTSLVLYGMFVLTQTVRHRDFFLPVVAEGDASAAEEHAPPPSAAATRMSLALLTVSLAVSLNLAFGSAMASIGLTIPVIAVASMWLEGPLELGLGPTQIILLLLTVVVGVLTVVPGRATRLQGGVHLVLLAAFLFLAVNP